MEKKIGYPLFFMLSGVSVILLSQVLEVYTETEESVNSTLMGFGLGLAVMSLIKFFLPRIKKE